MAGVAPVETPETGVMRRVDGRFVFIRPQSTIYLLKGLGIHPTCRVILVHDIDIGVGSKFLSQKLHDGRRSGDPSRHNQVPNQHTTSGQTIFIHLQYPHLAMHLS